AERHLALGYAVTRVLADAATLEEAAPRILQAICQHVSWEAGVLWIKDRQDNVLRCVDVWYALGANLTEFESTTRNLVLAPGTGLPGLVWVKAEAAWVSDIVSADLFPKRGQAAARNGLHSAFAFPILFGKEVTGV